MVEIHLSMREKNSNQNKLLPKKHILKLMKDQNQYRGKKDIRKLRGMKIIKHLGSNRGMIIMLQSPIKRNIHSNTDRNQRNIVRLDSIVSQKTIGIQKITARRRSIVNQGNIDRKKNTDNQDNTVRKRNIVSQENTVKKKSTDLQDNTIKKGTIDSKEITGRSQEITVKEHQNNTVSNQQIIVIKG